MPMSRKPQDGASQENAFAPSSTEPLICEGFAGINTATSRAGVDDKQMWWSDGWMPLAPRRLRTLPDVGTALWTRPGSASIVFFKWVNIGTMSVAIVFLADGSIYQVTAVTGTQTLIATAGTILDPAIQNVGVSQWSNQWIIIVANQTNGYWLWDGT